MPSAGSAQPAPPPRSWLYVPGDRPDRLRKAMTSGADAVIADLEDAVAPDQKDQALEEVLRWLSESTGEPRPARWVRVNTGDRLADEVRQAAEGGALGVLVPKATIATMRNVVATAEGIKVAPLIESAAGVLEARELAAIDGVSHLGLGEADLAADLGVEPARFSDALISARVHLVLVSAAAGISGPAGPTSLEVRDLSGLEASTRALRDLGFTSRTCIHPAQVPVVNDVFTPSATETAEAERVLAASAEASAGGLGVTVLDGRLVDEAVVRRARNTLARSTASDEG